MNLSVCLSKQEPHDRSLLLSCKDCLVSSLRAHQKNDLESIEISLLTCRKSKMLNFFIDNIFPRVLMCFEIIIIQVFLWPRHEPISMEIRPLRAPHIPDPVINGHLSHYVGHTTHHTTLHYVGHTA